MGVPVARTLPIALLAVVVACSGEGSSSDAGTDTGSETDEDTDSGSETDTETEPECNTEGDWTWHDIPEGEDCGPGCTQLTFIEEDGIQSEDWDVWGDYVVYNESPYGTFQAHVIDLVQRKDLSIPSPVPGLETGFEGIAQAYQTVFEDSVFYGFKNYTAEPMYRGIARVALSDSCQQILFHETGPSLEGLYPFYHPDVYGDIFVSATTADDANDRRDLVYLDAAHPEEGLHVLILSDDYLSYGFHNQIWGDHIVWTDGLYPPPPYNILGYNLATEEFFDVINDDEPHQFMPRIWDGKVVYTDLRNGNGHYQYDWENADVYLHEIATETTTRITDGEWIQCLPDIWENIIVWADYRDSTDPNNANDFSGVEIYSYDLVTEEETKVTDLPGRGKLFPRVFGNRVFFEMKDSEHDIQLFMVELPE